MPAENGHPNDLATRDQLLNLQRPIVFLDIQTTGPDKRTARIVRLCTLKIETNGEEEFRSHLINPKSPISPGATDFHGISDEDVVDCKPFASYAKALSDYLDGCDLAGFGIRRFHLKVLQSEFQYAGIDFDLKNRAIVDTMEVYHQLEPRDFEAAYSRYVGGEYRDGSAPEHRINAVRSILHGQLTQNPDLPVQPDSLEQWATGATSDRFIDDQGRFTLSDAGDPIINFGRYRGHSLYDMSETHPDYLRWIAGHESFTDEQRQIAADAAEGIMPDFE